MSRSGKLSRLFPKLFGENKKTTSQSVQNGCNVCNILFLDGTEQIFSYKKSWKGQVLLDCACERIDLLERSYFGLRYVDTAGQALWIELSKSIESQLKGLKSTPKLYFCVKFYAADPCKLKEELTRYLFFLQLKLDILQGQLPIHFDDACELCAYAVQSELGDFNPKVHTPGYVSEFNFVPNQTEELETRIAAFHRLCVGVTSSMAEYRFLEKVKWLEMYGIDLHQVQGEGSIEYFLGISPTGVVVFKQKSKIATYFWPRIIKSSCKGKIFMIKVKDKNSDEHTFAFELSTKSATKHLWKCTLEHHDFFRKSQIQDKESRPRKALRSLSNVSLSRERPENPTSRQQPNVLRVASRKKPRRVNSDSKLNGSPRYSDISRFNKQILTTMDEPVSIHGSRHRSLPELKGGQSPTSVKSAPWQTNFDYGLFTSGHASSVERGAASHNTRPTSGSDSESNFSNRKRYFPGRHKGSDNESETSGSRRRRCEIDSGSGSETDEPWRKRTNNKSHQYNAKNVSILYPFDVKENRLDRGSIPSLHSAPVGEFKQRRRRRSKSAGALKRPPKELQDHFQYGLQEIEGKTAEELQNIPFTKVETKAGLFRVKYSPKLRQKIWASRKSQGKGTELKDTNRNRRDSSEFSTKRKELNHSQDKRFLNTPSSAPGHGDFPSSQFTPNANNRLKSPNTSLQLENSMTGSVHKTIVDNETGAYNQSYLVKPNSSNANTNFYDRYSHEPHEGNQQTRRSRSVANYNHPAASNQPFYGQNYSEFASNPHEQTRTPYSSYVDNKRSSPYYTKYSDEFQRRPTKNNGNPDLYEQSTQSRYRRFPEAYSQERLFYENNGNLIVKHSDPRVVTTNSRSSWTDKDYQSFPLEQTREFSRFDRDTGSSRKFYSHPHEERSLVHSGHNSSDNHQKSFDFPSSYSKGALNSNGHPNNNYYHSTQHTTNSGHNLYQSPLAQTVTDRGQRFSTLSSQMSYEPFERSDGRRQASLRQKPLTSNTPHYHRKSQFVTEL